MHVQNAGTLEVQAARARLGLPTSSGSSSGTFTVTAGAGLDFYGTHTLGASSSVAGAGAVTFAGSGTRTVNGTYDIAGGTTVSGGTADFDGAVSVAFGDLTLAAGATLRLDNNATVSGDLVRNGGTFSSSTGTISFTGSATQELTMNVATTFFNLTVGSGTTLVETVATDNATVDGTLTNDGTIRKARAVSGPGALTFGLTGIAIDVTTPGTLSSLQVDRIDTYHPDANARTDTGKYWTITPTGSGYTVSLTLPHNLADHTKAEVCRYTGSGWDCARTSSTPTTVTRTGVTTLSDWAVGDSNPTPVHLLFFRATASRGGHPGGVADCVRTGRPGIQPLPERESGRPLRAAQ